MYDFRTLSPLDFEEIVRDLLQAEFSLRLESFGSGRDLGIDFRFSSGAGRSIVQAKHYYASRPDALVRAMREENEKVKRLNPSRYILATSASVTPHLKSRIRASMVGAPLADEDVLGREDLNNLLGRHPEIERKHFKLWLASTTVLERILHSGVYNRTQAEMDVIKSVVPKFVQNQSVRKSEEILERHRVLIISGEPGVGKSTLARILVWLHAEQDWRISVIDDISEAFEIVSHDEKHLIFFDDFLGQVRLSADLIRGVDQRLPPFLQKVRSSKNIRFILTTRDYIFHQAQNQSSRLSDPKVNALEFTLNVGMYTREVKAKILYNHLYFSQLSPAERDALLTDNFFLKVIDHKNFNPRLIDFLTSPDYLALGGRPIREAVQSVLDNPQALWDVPYRTHISDEGRVLMIALFFNSERVAILLLEDAFSRMAKAMGLSIPRMDLPMKFRSALKELEGSVFAIESSFVRFSNPGVRDFLLRVVLTDRLLPAALQMAAEYSELNQIWTIYSNQCPRPNLGLDAIDLWLGATSRLLISGRGSALRRLELLIDIYDALRSDRLLTNISIAARQLEEAEIDDGDAPRSRGLLETLKDAGLPPEIEAAVRRSLSIAVGEMLKNYGGGLALDELRATAKALVQHGVEEDTVLEAPQSAVEAHIQSIKDVLSDLSSTDELDGYEEELTALMREFDVHDWRVDEYITERRIELVQREAAREGYEFDSSWRRAGQSEGMSDEAIKSLFSGLRERDD